MGRGIDYGMGTTNVDHQTGIRFGVIGVNADGLTEWVWESFEADYGDPHCPKCGNEVLDTTSGEEPVMEQGDDPHEDWDGKDYYCQGCRYSFWSDEAYGDEPVGHTMTEAGYEGHIDSSNDIWVTKSPYYTLAQFCSPCAPGAGHLENPDPDGVKTYCLGHQWFKDETAPYPVFRVGTDEPVPPGKE